MPRKISKIWLDKMGKQRKRECKWIKELLWNLKFKERFSREYFDRGENEEVYLVVTEKMKRHEKSCVKYCLTCRYYWECDGWGEVVVIL